MDTGHVNFSETEFACNDFSVDGSMTYQFMQMTISLELYDKLSKIFNV